MRMTPSLPPRRVCADAAPRQTRILGSTSAIWRRVKGRQAAVSSGVGVRFPGGRQEQLAACCGAWNALIAQSEVIASIGTKDWAQVKMLV
jgi:hypothetical protein